jgi:hypothetical protein
MLWRDRSGMKSTGAEAKNEEHAISGFTALDEASSAYNRCVDH